MASIEDLRKWLEGSHVEGLPSRVPVWDQSKPKSKPKPRQKKKETELSKNLRKAKERATGVIDGRFTISGDGKDAILHFGKHKNRALSELIKTHPGYLDWIMREDFPASIKDVIGYLYKAFHGPAPSFTSKDDIDEEDGEEDDEDEVPF